MNENRRSHPPDGRPFWRRLRVVVAAFLAAVLFGVGAAAALAWYGKSLIVQDAVRGLTSPAQAAEPEPAGDEPPPPRRVNVLVVGEDSRDGLTPEQIAEFGQGVREGHRTDTIMLLQLEVNGEGRAAALSFPRDLKVERCDGSVGRINAAYSVGVMRDGDGPSCLVSTVRDLTGVPIHHYVQVSFAGFVRIVDAIGGVGLYLDEPIVDTKAHVNLPAGCVRMTGAQALGFVRARHIDSDFGRIARQQRFIKETIREGTRLGVLYNPGRLLELVDAAASAVKTDDALGLAEMQEIAGGMRALTSEGLRVHTVPSVDSRTAAGWYVVEIPDQAAELYRSFRDGSVLDTKPQKPQVRIPPVTVKNAAGEPGLAAAAAELLRVRGFAVGEVGNAAVDVTETRVFHAPHLQEAAEDIADLLGGAQLVEGVSDVGLVVELGPELDAEQLLDRVRTTSLPATETPTPEASPTPAYRGAGESDVDC